MLSSEWLMARARPGAASEIEIPPHWWPDMPGIANREADRQLASPQASVHTGRKGVLRPGEGNLRAFLQAGGQRRAAWWAGLIVAVLFQAAPAGAASDDNKVFTIGNYPIEARAANAVAAKEQAIAEGQQAALRSLFKRLVPVTAYKRLDGLKTTRASDLIEGFSVRSERNSTTEYIASYDFSFQPDAVRRLLSQQGIPFVDQQASPLTVVTVYRAPPDGSEAFSDARGSDAWLYGWKAMDLANAVTPIALKPLQRSTRPETLKAVIDGDPSAIRTLAGEYHAVALVLAILEPDIGARRIKVTLAGQDTVGPLRLSRTYRLEGDLTYTTELAALISLGILEGRWKAVTAKGGDYAGGGSGMRVAGGSTMRIAVEFNGMPEWQIISRQLSETPEVSDLEVEGLSARGARLALKFPGGPETLAQALAERGLTLRSVGNGWVLTGR